MNAFDLDGAIVPVTGAASGIGLAICKRLQANGATPLLLDVNEAALEDAVQAVYQGRNREMASRFGYVVDVSRSAAVDECFEAIRRDHGPVTHAVSNAGISLAANLLEMSDKQWHRVIDINVHGMMYVCRAAARHLVEAKRGAIVTVASIAGLRAKENRTAYSTSKGAVVNMTRALAMDLGRFGIRVNAVAPGVIDTPQQQMNAGAYHEMMAGKTALGRTGKPEEIANAVLFLLSDLASYLTAETIVVDGGLIARFA